MELRQGIVISKQEGKIKDKTNKQTIIAQNPAKVDIKDGDDVTYISYVSYDKNSQTIIHVIKDKKIK